jgi:H+/gluconate symporter-like permease
MFGLGHAWLTRQAARARAAGEGYGEHDEARPRFDKEQRELSAGEGFDVSLVGADAPPRGLPPFLLAFSPIAVVIVLNYVFSAHLIPALDTAYLAEPRYGSSSIDAVRGVWSIIGSLTVACALLVVLCWRRFGSLKRTIDDGANASVLPIFNTASLVGFGAVIAALPAFGLIRSFVEDLGAGNPLVSLSLAVNLLAGITGSASGGMSIALQTLGADYLEMARQAGISAEVLHRVTTVATGGLDSLPHNGAVVTLLAICGLTHRQAYKDIFMVAALFPILSLIGIVTLASVFGGF